MGYIERLIENCHQALTSKPAQEFVMTNHTELKDIKKAIYVIEQIGGDIKKTFDDFLTFKQSTERACPKSNAPSQIMYVGSSTTGLLKRISEHIGDGSKSTSAMHLRHWYKGDYQIKIKIYNETSDVIQIIEDDLSDQLKPAFGKRGGNNK